MKPNSSIILQSVQTTEEPLVPIVSARKLNLMDIQNLLKNVQDVNILWYVLKDLPRDQRPSETGSKINFKTVFLSFLILALKMNL
jgi:hypothetical protein